MRRQAGLHEGVILKTLAIVLSLFAFAAQARDVSITWDDYAAQEPGAVGIHVYTQEFNYTQSACQAATTTRQTNAPIPATAISYIITGLDDALTYCIWVRGINAAGVESDYSNAAMFFAPRPPFAGPGNVQVTP